MRFAVAALCVLALTGSAEANSTGACAAYDDIPEQFRQTPTVEWSFKVVPLSVLNIECRDPTFIACDYENKDGSWTVFVADTFSAEEQACALQYEMAHMPPNYWGNPRVERPEAMKWLAGRKAIAN